MNRKRMRKDKAPTPCPNCGNDTSAMRAPAYSMKFNSHFCNQECYEDYRNKLDVGLKKENSQGDTQ